MLRTPIQRAAVLVLLCGLGTFAFGIFRWLADYRNHWVLHTRYIPDYPVDYIGSGSFPTSHDGVIRKHRSCAWESASSPVSVSGVDKQERDGGDSTVMKSDNFLTVDSVCARHEIALLEPGALYYGDISSAGNRNRYWNASLAVGLGSYEKILFDESSGASFWWSTMPLQSGRDYYKQKVVEELQRAGYSALTAKSISEKCINAELRQCVETSRSTNVRIWAIARSDPLMLSGAALILLGLVGSVFYAPLRWLVGCTIGRVSSWVKNGS